MTPFGIQVLQYLCLIFFVQFEVLINGTLFYRVLVLHRCLLSFLCFVNFVFDTSVFKLYITVVVPFFKKIF